MCGTEHIRDIARIRGIERLMVTLNSPCYGLTITA